MHILLSYIPAFEEDYDVCFMGVHIIDILEEMVSSCLLAAKSIGTYVRYIKVATMIRKHQGGLSIPLKLSKDAQEATTFRITLFDDKSFYISSEEDILLITQAADAFDKNHHKSASF